MVELNISYSTQRQGSAYADSFPAIILGYGITDFFQVFVSSSWSTTNQGLNGHASGFGDTDLGVKWRFMDQGDGKLQISTAPQFVFNTSQQSINNGLVAKDSSLFLPIEACKSLGPIDADIEVGYRFHKYFDNEFCAGLCLGKEFKPGLEFDAELNGVCDLGDRTWTKYVNVGTRYRLGKGVGFLGSVGTAIGHFDGSKPWIGFVGLQYDF